MFLILCRVMVAVSALAIGCAMHSWFGADVAVALLSLALALVIAGGMDL